MFSSIKTSIKNKLIVTELTRKLGLGPENTVARLAFAYSLAKGRMLDLKNIQDSKGKEYSKNVLFGHNLPYYVALVCQHYNIYKTDKDISKYIKLHIDDGLELLYNDYSTKKNVSGLDFVLSLIDHGLKN